jgi:hypothetical protein
MQPLTVIIGIVMGSAVSLAAGLILTFITLLFVSSRLEGEVIPLTEAIVVFTLISAAAGASFVGELKLRRWRFTAHAGTVLALALAVWMYWPR